MNTLLPEGRSIICIMCGHTNYEEEAPSPTWSELMEAKVNKFNKAREARGLPMATEVDD